MVAPGDVCGVGQAFRLPAEVLGEHNEETEDKEWSWWKKLTNTQCVFDGHPLQLSSSNGPSIQIRDRGQRRLTSFKNGGDVMCGLRFAENVVNG